VCVCVGITVLVGHHFVQAVIHIYFLVSTSFQDAVETVQGFHSLFDSSYTNACQSDNVVVSTSDKSLRACVCETLAKSAGLFQLSTKFQLVSNQAKFQSTADVTLSALVSKLSLTNFSVG